MNQNDINDKTTVAKIGSFIKDRNIGLEISYGSGGFCVILKNTNNSTGYGYSWDITEAMQKAISSLNQTEVKTLLKEYTEDDDEATRPDIKIDETIKNG